MLWGPAPPALLSAVQSTASGERRQLALTHAAAGGGPRCRMRAALCGALPVQRHRGERTAINLHCLALPSLDLSTDFPCMTSHCLSLTSHCLSLTSHCLSVTSHCLSVTSHCLSSCFHCIPVPETAVTLLNSAIAGPPTARASVAAGHRAATQTTAGFLVPAAHVASPLLPAPLCSSERQQQSLK